MAAGGTIAGTHNSPGQRRALRQRPSQGCRGKLSWEEPRAVNDPAEPKQRVLRCQAEPPHRPRRCLPLPPDGLAGGREGYCIMKRLRLRLRLIY